MIKLWFYAHKDDKLNICRKPQASKLHAGLVPGQTYGMNNPLSAIECIENYLRGCGMDNQMIVAKLQVLLLRAKSSQLKFDVAPAPAKLGDADSAQPLQELARDASSGVDLTSVGGSHTGS